MIASKNPRLYESHNKHLQFRRVVANVERLAAKNGVRYAIYFDKLLKNYSWVDTYINSIVNRNRIPQSEIICEIDFED